MFRNNLYVYRNDYKLILEILKICCSNTHLKKHEVNNILLYHFYYN